MKYLLIVAALFLTGCNKSENCPSTEFRNFIYNESVKVVSGFYKGQTGKIVSGVWVYERECGIPGFVVRLDFNNSEVKINQYNIETNN